MNAHPLDDKASLSGVRRQIRAELNTLGVDPSQLFDCLIAVTEAGTRALLHMAPGRRPMVWWEIARDRARFYIRDFAGEAWSRVSHPSHRGDDPEAGEHYGEYGLAIVNDLMDEVDVDVGPNGTVVCLVKHFT